MLKKRFKLFIEHASGLPLSMFECARKGFLWLFATKTRAVTRYNHYPMTVRILYKCVNNIKHSMNTCVYWKSLGLFLNGGVMWYLVKK